MAAASEMSRVNFNPDWMGTTFSGSVPAKFSSSTNAGGGGGGGNTQTNNQNGTPNINDTILAPPKLSKNRYGREELLALFTGVDTPAPSRLKEDFTDFYLPTAQNPICMAPFSEIEQRLLLQGGINSSKVINVVNHAERQQRWTQQVPRGGGMAGGGGFGRGSGVGEPPFVRGEPPFPRGGEPPFARGGEPPFARGRPMTGIDGGPPRFLGMGRGRGETRGGLRQVGGLGEPYDHSPVLRSTSGRDQQQRASEEEWTPPPQNTRAQGLYDPNNPRDRPRQRLKSTSKPDEAEETNGGGAGAAVNNGVGPAAAFNRSQRRTKSVSSQDQSVPEWAKDDEEDEDGLGTFDATGNFRPGIDEMENTKKLLIAPTLGTASVEEKRSTQNNDTNNRPIPSSKNRSNNETNLSKTIENSYDEFSETSVVPAAVYAKKGKMLMAPVVEATVKNEDPPFAAARRTPQAFSQVPSSKATAAAPANQIKVDPQSLINSAVSSSRSPLLKAPTAATPTSQMPAPMKTASPTLSEKILTAPMPSASPFTKTLGSSAPAPVGSSSYGRSSVDAHSPASYVIPRTLNTQQSQPQPQMQQQPVHHSLLQRPLSTDDHVFQKLHQQAEHLVSSVCLDESNDTLKRSNLAELTIPEDTLWYYKDPSGKIQGPFENNQMANWFRSGYFTMQLMIRRAVDNTFIPLGDLIKRCGNKIPFFNLNNSSSPGLEPHQQNSNFAGAPTPKMAANPMSTLGAGALATDGGGGAGVGAFKNTGAFNQPLKTTGQPSRSIWDLDPSPSSMPTRSASGPQLSESVANFFNSVTGASQLPNNAPAPGQTLQSPLDHSALQLMIDRYAKQQEEERKKLEDEQRRRLEEEQKKIVEMQDKHRREKEETERNMREMEEKMVRQREELMQKELRQKEQRAREQQEEEQKRQVVIQQALQQKRLEDLAKKAAIEEKKRRVEEEERQKQLLKEEREREQREMKKLEVERRQLEDDRKKAAQKRAANEKSALAAAAWIKIQEKSTAGQSLKEIQMEEERQLVAEARQQLEIDLQRQEDVKACSLTTATAGAWGNSSTKNLSWDKPVERQTSSTVKGSGSSPWATNAPAVDNQGFWDDDPSLQTIGTGKKPAQEQKKKSKSNTKQQPPSAQKFQPKNSNAENAVKRLFAASSPTDEFSVWCVKQVKKLNKEFDENEALIFVDFLKNVPDAEVEDYVFGYFSDSQPSKDFLKGFFERRSLLKKGKGKETATSDDLAAPASALMPVNLTVDKESTNGQNQIGKKKPKKGPGSKRSVVDTSILGFKTASDPNRVNVGEIDSPM